MYHAGGIILLLCLYARTTRRERITPAPITGATIAAAALCATDIILLQVHKSYIIIILIIIFIIILCTRIHYASTCILRVRSRGSYIAATRNITTIIYIYLPRPIYGRRRSETLSPDARALFFFFVLLFRSVFFFFCFSRSATRGAIICVGRGRAIVLVSRILVARVHVFYFTLFLLHFPYHPLFVVFLFASVRCNLSRRRRRIS